MQLHVAKNVAGQRGEQLPAGKSVEGKGHGGGGRSRPHSREGVGQGLGAMSSQGSEWDAGAESRTDLQAAHLGVGWVMAPHCCVHLQGRLGGACAHPPPDLCTGWMQATC